MRRRWDLVKMILAGVGVLLAIGLSIGSTRVAPPHAIVYIDASAGVYYAPPCLRSKTNYDISTLQAARNGGYRSDRQCRNQGGFVQDGRSLTGGLLEAIGILSEKESRWSPEGRWRW